MSARLSTLDDKYQAAFPVHGQWIADLQDTTGELSGFVINSRLWPAKVAEAS